MVLAAAVVALFYWWQRDFATDWLPGIGAGQQARAPYAGPTPPDFIETPQGGAARPVPPAPAAAPQARYPVPEYLPAPGEPPLPPPEKSDPLILEALRELAGGRPLGRFGNLDDFTRRFVVTVDNLPREMVPSQYSAAQRIPGALAIAEEGGKTVLKPENYVRYVAFVDFVERMGPKSMVAVYERFYPLLQEEYRSLGYPRGRFNDRVIEAIDDMLAAPQPQGPIEVVQPRVHFRFADPALERLSAGQKIMVRIGPENAARLKKVLREIRRELVD
jgi:hypothetical protein